MTRLPKTASTTGPRWTGVLQAALGGDFTVIEEGLNGRTTVWNDPIEGYKNGHDYLVPCLETHRPLDSGGVDAWHQRPQAPFLAVCL